MEKEKEKESIQDDFYLHNLLCHICNSYYFNQNYYANNTILKYTDKFSDHPLLNLLVNIYTFNCLRDSYNIDKNVYEIEKTYNGGWNDDVICKNWDNNENYFEYYDTTPVDIKYLYSELLIKGFPFIMYQSVDISKLKEIYKKDNFISVFGKKNMIDFDNKKSINLDVYVENMNTEYFFHEGKDNMGVDFSHTDYIPPDWYLLYNHHWGEVKKIDNVLKFQQSSEYEKIENENENENENNKKVLHIKLTPQIYIGAGGSGTFFEISPGFIDTLVYGKRRWFIYDPNMYIFLYNSGINIGNGDVGNVEKWLDTHYEKLKEKPYYCIQNQDETIYIPAGWFCMCLNLTECIGHRLSIGTHNIHIDNFFKTKQVIGCVPTDMTLS